MPETEHSPQAKPTKRPAFDWPRAGKIVFGLALVAALVRLHNVWFYPYLRAPDGWGHFAYIWFVAETGRVPLASSGWSFFHPPLYYAFAATIWNTLTSVDPATRVKIAIGAVSMFGLAAHSRLAWTGLRRQLPDQPLVAVVGVGVICFLPLHLYTAGYIGNEGLGAALASSSLLALLSLLRNQTLLRAALLGLMLGLTMLVKFTGLAVVAGSFATIGLRSLVRREFRRGLQTLGVMALVMVSVCGWYYARNIVEFGTPFQMSRDSLAVRRVENIQTMGERSALEYLLFDPLILLRPHWPRDLPLQGPIPEDFPRSALRESVWTGVFANSFFDAVGGQVLPKITHSNESRRAGQILLVLGLFPAALVLVGIASALADLLKRGWDDTHAAMLLSFAAMLGIFVIGTITVPMHAAIKPTYLTPAAGIFAYWVGIGFARFTARFPRATALSIAQLGVLATASITVFTLGAFVGKGFLSRTPDNPTWKNAYGVIAYAGGDHTKARTLFEEAAAGHHFSAHENLAKMLADEGENLQALYYLRKAKNLQPTFPGLPMERDEFLQIQLAEFDNKLAVHYHRMGWWQQAILAAEHASHAAPAIAEARFNLAALKIERAHLAPSLRDQAMTDAALALALDPTLAAAEVLRAEIAALEGDCHEARAAQLSALRIENERAPAFPYETGAGDIHTVALDRRPIIRQWPSISLQECN